MIRRQMLYVRRGHAGYGENLGVRLASDRNICKPIEFLQRHQGSAWRLPLIFRGEGRGERGNAGSSWRVRRCSYRTGPIGSAEERVQHCCSRVPMWSSQLGGTQDALQRGGGWWWWSTGQTIHRGTIRHDSVKEAPGTTTAFRSALAHATCAAAHSPSSPSPCSVVVVVEWFGPQ